MGAGKFRQHHADALAGRKCVLLPDNDEPGRKHMRQVREMLAGADARIVELPDLAEEGDDIIEWIAAGHTRECLVNAAWAEKPEPPLTGKARDPEPPPAESELDYGYRACAPHNEPEPWDETSGVQLGDFHAYMVMHNYIFAPARALWPGSSVDARVPPIKLTDANGEPVLDSNGKQVTLRATTWLDQNRPVEQITWAPGQPMVIRDRLIIEGGWIYRRGVSCFNLYRPPAVLPGDAAKADKWLDHIRYIYPDEADHIINYLAHRVQQPQEKINHALVLGGTPGIGKDTILEPVKYAVGPWNLQEASPKQVCGRFNGFLKSVVLRISEARDLGEFDRFQFYDHMKTYTAAPPDVLRVDEKNLREYSILNCCGVIITTNYKTDGIYLPADDRRNYVCWSDATKEDERFQGDYWKNLWGYYANGGLRHVAAYLRQRDISAFDPKAPPPKTEAFWVIVNANRPAEQSDMADAIERATELAAPAIKDTSVLNALTLLMVRNATQSEELREFLDDPRRRRQVPHRLEECDYVAALNPDAQDGLWKIKGKRQAVYARKELSLHNRLAAARKLVEWLAK